MLSKQGPAKAEEEEMSADLCGSTLPTRIGIPKSHHHSSPSHQHDIQINAPEEYRSQQTSADAPAVSVTQSGKASCYLFLIAATLRDISLSFHHRRHGM